MASTDAKPVPVKGQAYRVTFPLFASDGALALGQTLLSQISVDAASAVYGARPVEITANMGLYYLDLTAANMAGQTIAIVATPLGGGSGPNIAVRPVPIILYPQGPTAAFYSTVMSIDATALATVASAVWASPTRTLSSYGTLQGDIVNAVWATPARSISSMAQAAYNQIASQTWDEARNAHNAAGTFGNLLQSFGVTVATLSSSGEMQVASAVWGSPRSQRNAANTFGHLVQTFGVTVATSTTAHEAQMASGVWGAATKTITGLSAAALADFFDTNSGTTYAASVAGSVVKEIADNAGGATLTALEVATAVWDSPRSQHNISTTFGNLVQTSGVTVATNNDKTGYAVGTGGITSLSFDTGAIDAAAVAADTIGSSELAQSAAQEVADEMLNRNLAGGGSGGARIVRDALRALRNRVAIDSGAGTFTIYQEDDATTAFTGTIATDSSTSRITGTDPA